MLTLTFPMLTWSDPLHQSCCPWTTRDLRNTKRSYLIMHVVPRFLRISISAADTFPLEITKIACRRVARWCTPHCKYTLHHTHLNISLIEDLRDLNRRSWIPVILAQCLVRPISPKPHSVNVTHEDHVYLDHVDLDHYACLNKKRSILPQTPKGSRSPRGSGSRVSEYIQLMLDCNIILIYRCEGCTYDPNL